MSELGLRYYQEDAVRAVEKAIVKGQQEILAGDGDRYR